MFNFLNRFRKNRGEVLLPRTKEGDYRMIAMIAYTHYLPGAIECATLELLESADGVRDVIVDTSGNMALDEDCIASSPMWKMRVKPWLQGYLSNRQFKELLKEKDYIMFVEDSNVKDMFSELLRSLEREECFEVANLIQKARNQYDNSISKV